MIGLQPPQLLREVGFHAVWFFDQVMGKLGGNVYLIPDVVPGENLAQCGFAAGVNIGGIEIIHTGMESFHDFLLGFVYVDFSGGLGKTHTAIAQNGNGIAVSVTAVLHMQNLL